MSGRLADSGVRGLSVNTYVNQEVVALGSTFAAPASVDPEVVQFLLRFHLSRAPQCVLSLSTNEWRDRIVPLLLQDPIAVAAATSMAALCRKEPGEVQASVEYDVLRGRYLVSFGLFFREDQYTRVKVQTRPAPAESTAPAPAQPPQRRLILRGLKSISDEKEGGET